MSVSINLNLSPIFIQCQIASINTSKYTNSDINTNDNRLVQRCTEKYFYDRYTPENIYYVLGNTD